MIMQIAIEKLLENQNFRGNCSCKLWKSLGKCVKTTRRQFRVICIEVKFSNFSNCVSF